MRDILGGKGAGLAEMANLGLPVPPGFTISAKLCLTYLEQGTFPDQLHDEVGRHLKQLEQATRKKFGDPKNPLLVSVRSGAAVSMPGMMETILPPSCGARSPPCSGAGERGGRRTTARCTAYRTTSGRR